MSRPINGAKVFRAVADPTRRRMLDLLLQSERRAGELVRPFHISRAAVAQHLRVLRHAGLVTQRRVGRGRVYRLEAQRLREVAEWIGRYTSCWSDAGGKRTRVAGSRS